MATKKTEAPDEDVKQEIENMTMWEKLMHVRQEFYGEGATKSGKNLHAEFKYFELEDIVPIADPIFYKYNLLMVTDFTEDFAVALIVNVKNPRESISFRLPLRFIAEPAKFRMNETQAAGAVVTYYRRYLYAVVLNLLDDDKIDAGLKEPKGSTPAAPPAPKKPVSKEERKEIKQELTSEDGNADEASLSKLKALLKTLLDKDDQQEEFVQEVALRTENFKTIKASKCTALIESVKQMLAEYEG